MRESRRIAYQPALDGVRAVAVVLVVLFHGGVSWMSGGYVGVSVFFTLSGFLITTLLLAEHGDRGRIDVVGFYGRRMKRLLPASLTCIGGVVLLSAAGHFAGVARLRTDVLGALFQVFNWTKLAAGESYAQLVDATIGRVAPLDHYWSLAIEEQFYWLWPVVMVVLLGALRSPVRRFAVLAGLWAASLVTAVVIARRVGPDAAYWATPARLGEILAGASLAGWIATRSDAPRRGGWLGPCGLAVVVVAAVAWPAAGGPAYEGWLPVFALASVALIAGLQVPGSALGRVLSWRPLVRLGEISYGVYLYHWPVFALVDERRVHGGGIALLAVRVAVTLAVATVSYVVIERPVRRWTVPAHRAALPVVGGLVATAGFAVVALIAVAPDQPTGLAGTAVNGITPVSGTLPALVTVAPEPSNTSAPTTSGGSLAPGTAAATSVPLLNRPVRIIVTGDSTADATGVGLAGWATANPTLAEVTLDAQPGCGFLRRGDIPGDPPVYEEQCTAILDVALPRDIAALQPDVVVLMVTLRDVEDRTFDGDGALLSPLDPRFAAELRDAYRSTAESLIARGVPRLAWVLAPFPAVPWQGEQVKMADPARYAVQFDVIREVAAEHPDRIVVVDLDGWLRGIGGLTDTSWRPDGLHFSPAASVKAAEEFLGPAVVSAALG